MNIEFRSKPGRKRKIKDEDKCLVCGGKSIGLNFGVHTCSPCKAFFRRNAVKLGVGYSRRTNICTHMFVFRHMNFNVEMMGIVR
jgi:hypothetical protein